MVFWLGQKHLGFIVLQRKEKSFPHYTFYHPDSQTLI